MYQSSPIITKRNLFARTLTLSRRALLTGGPISVVSAYGYSRYVEPSELDLTHAKIPFEFKLKAPIQILHLSDLHLSRFAPLSLIETAIGIGMTARPDVVAITGDFITSGEEWSPRPYGDTLSRLAKSIPVFACLGNHDGGVWAMNRKSRQKYWVIGKFLEDSGIHVLHNRAETIEVAGGTIQLVGLGDLWAEETDPPAAFRDCRNLPTVVLAHNPDIKDLIVQYPWQLMLSGHTHGGQVVLPVIGPCFAPVRDRRFIAGLYEWRGRWIFITRGVGNLYGYRFCCRPEVSILELV